MRFAFSVRGLAPLLAVFGVIAVDVGTTLTILNRSQAAIVEAETVERSLSAQSDYMLLLAETESYQRAYLLFNTEQFRRTFEDGLARLRARGPRLLTELTDGGISAAEAERFAAAAEKRILTMEEVVRLKRSGAKESDILSALNRGLTEMTLAMQLGEQTRRALSERLRQERFERQRAIRTGLFTNPLLGIVVLTLGLMGFLRLNHSLTENEKAMRAVAAEKDRYRKLARKLDTAREDERAEMARNIHDDLGQRLTAIKMDLAIAIRKLRPADGAVKEQIDSAMQMADEAIQTVRGLAMELRPALLDQLGLEAALKWQLDEFTRRTGISTALEVSSECPNVDGQFSISAYRIIQEALTNSWRHSGANRILVTLRATDRAFEAVVEDNGRGFDPVEARARSVGMLGMEERARLVNGTVEFLSLPGAGAKVVVRLPLPGMERSKQA